MNTNEKMRSRFVAIHDEIKKYLAKEINDTSLCLRIKNIVNKALAIPRRNCDVGTAEEQEERYIKLKREHIDKLTRCPAVGPSFFPDSLYWAQMPYYSNVGTVCRDCAKAAGFTPKDKAVGEWSDECEICHEHKWCTSLWHDWDPPRKEEHCADFEYDESGLGKLGYSGCIICWKQGRDECPKKKAR